LLFISLSPLVSLFASPIMWIAALVVGFWLPKFWLGRRKGKRLKAFNTDLADTIMLLANGLRAGSSFLQAVEMIVRETRPPISTEFARVIREVNLGLPLDEALSNLQRRVRSDDLDLMTTAIAIHHTVGGNLAEILDTIAFTIRERVRIKGEIRTLTAQQRMSGYVVGFLPIALVLLLSVIAPAFMAPMLQKPPELLGLPAGMFILAGGGFMMLIGFILIRRIIDIEV
jgi:tight adherence protein B